MHHSLSVGGWKRTLMWGRDPSWSPGHGGIPGIRERDLHVHVFYMLMRDAEGREKEASKSMY